MREAQPMSHLPIAPPAFLPAGRRRLSVQSPEDLDEDFLNKVKSYLECRSRGVDPAPPLVEAWNHFYDSYAPRVRRFLGQWDLADQDRNDCFQDVWKEVIVKLAHFQHDPTRGCLATWLMTLARNKAVDSIRRRSRQLPKCLGRDGANELLDPHPDPGTEYERRRTQALVRSVLGELSGQVSRAQLPGTVSALDRGPANIRDRRRARADARASPRPHLSHEAKTPRPVRAIPGPGLVSNADLRRLENDWNRNAARNRSPYPASNDWERIGSRPMFCAVTTEGIAMNRRSFCQKLMCAMVIVAAVLGQSAARGGSLVVTAGYDLFQTVAADTSFPGLGNLMGVPLGTFNFGGGPVNTGLTDTIVQRLFDVSVPAVGDTGTTAIVMHGSSSSRPSLRSTSWAWDSTTTS